MVDKHIVAFRYYYNTAKWKNQAEKQYFLE
jgi:hypothetical protein